MTELKIDKPKNTFLKYLISIENRVRTKLIKRYDKPLSYHDIKMINDILYNEKTRYVEAFKEYLIYEDYNEFLKRYYKSLEIGIKLPKILIFYEKYSKIYANYTVIPESKYMYKNIKRKQKMIDQMQNNDINSEYEDDEESNEDISNTVFSSRVINSIYNKTLTSVNKSENSKNTEQSINEFLEKINKIENNEKNKEKKIGLNLLKLESNNNINHERVKKMRNNFLISKDKTPPHKRIKANSNSNNKYQFINDNKKIDIQINFKKKNSQKKNNNPQNKNNINQNANNKNNYNNLIFINSYTCKTKNNMNSFKNNFSIGNYINCCNNTFNNYTFSGNNYLRTNFNFPKQKLSSATFKQKIINSSNNNITEQRENMNLTNINNYFNKVNSINNQKYKLSLRETLFKLDKLILSTNVSNSPKILNENKFSTSSNKANMLNNKNNIKHSLLREKDKSENHKIKKDIKNKVQGLSHKILNTKKFRSNLFYHNYNSIGTNLTFLSNNKYQESTKVKNMFNKFTTKKSNNKYNEIISSNNNIKPESHRNFYHSRVLSGNNSLKKTKSNKVNINTNMDSKIYKITVNNNTKQGIKIDSKKIKFPYSPSNSGSDFYFTSQITSRKHSINRKKNTKLTKDSKKKKVVNNFNIVNNIHDNSTQINIFTGKDLYKSLRLQNKSLFNSTSISPSNISGKSPIQGTGVNLKNKKQLSIHKNILENNVNKNYLKSNIKGKEKPVKHNLDFKKIINKQFNEGEKAIISERLMNNNNKKLFEKIGNFFKKRKDKSNNNNNINSKKIIYKNKSNNSNKNINYTKQKHNNNDYTNLINKLITHRLVKNKTNNNTPIKTRYIPCTTKNHTKAPSVGSHLLDHELITKNNKAPNALNIKYNNIISNLNDLKNFGLDDGNKLLIHSERNKISKIVFK